MRKQNNPKLAQHLLNCTVTRLVLFQSTLELTNVTSTSRHVRVIPPTTPYFSLGLGEFLIAMIGLVFAAGHAVGLENGM